MEPDSAWFHRRFRLSTNQGGVFKGTFGPGSPPVGARLSWPTLTRATRVQSPSLHRAVI
jgi:hypothetical protein